MVTAALFIGLDVYKRQFQSKLDRVRHTKQEEPQHGSEL